LKKRRKKACKRAANVMQSTVHVQRAHQKVAAAKVPAACWCSHIACNVVRASHLKKIHCENMQLTDRGEIGARLAFAPL